MGLVNLKYKEHNIQINCEDEEHIKSLAEKLNDKLFKTSKNVSDTKILYITALTLQDEVDNVNDKLQAFEVKHNNHVNENIQLLTDTLNHVAEYIEKLVIELKK